MRYKILTSISMLVREYSQIAIHKAIQVCDRHAYTFLPYVVDTCAHVWQKHVTVKIFSKLLGRPVMNIIDG